MARPIRFIRPDSCVEITCRTLQGRLLLRPSSALSEIILGILGRAQRLYPVRIHAYVFLSNHYHLLITTPSAGRLARFMAYLNSNLAREAGRMHGWRQKFWGRRYQSIVVSDEERAQVSRLEYILAHGAKEDLVASPKDWPGVHCVQALLDPSQPIAGTWFDRSAEFRSRLRGVDFGPRDFASAETVELSPIPSWSGVSTEECVRRVGEIVEGIEQAASERRRASRVEPLGRAAVLRQRPWDEPRRSKRSPAPLVHATTRQVREAWRDAYRLFVASYRVASRAFRRGMVGVPFPEHCFPPAPGFFEGYIDPVVPWRSAHPAT